MPLAKTVVILLITCSLAAEDVTFSHRQDQTSSPPSSWAGHLKPLGSEATRVPVSVLDDFPSPAEFFQNYVYPSVPVIFRQGAKRSPAFEKWTDEYLRSLPESGKQVMVEMRKVEERKFPKMTMSFADFLDRYKIHGAYLVASVPDFLMKDVLIPPPLHCTNVTANFVETILWFSGGGTKSHVHTDYVDNINCLFRGHKDFLFINYTRYRDQILYDHPEGFYSSVDVERVDLNRFPGFRDIEFMEAKLEAGDCLFVPFKWMHQVNSHGSNIAVNIWWDHKAYVIPTPQACGNPDPGLSLADVSFYFQDEAHVFGQSDLHPELDLVKNPPKMLAACMEELQTEALTGEQFLEYLDMMVPSPDIDVWTEEAMNLAHQIFHQLDADGDGKITLEDIKEYPVQVNQKSPTQVDTFYIRLGQRMMVLSDVIDGEISKHKERILRDLSDSKKVDEGNLTSTSQEARNDLTGTSKRSSGVKSEL